LNEAPVIPAGACMAWFVVSECCVKSPIGLQCLGKGGREGLSACAVPVTPSSSLRGAVCWKKD